MNKNKYNILNVSFLCLWIIIDWIKYFKCLFFSLSPDGQSMSNRPEIRLYVENLYRSCIQVNDVLAKHIVKYIVKHCYHRKSTVYFGITCNFLFQASPFYSPWCIGVVDEGKMIVLCSISLNFKSKITLSVELIRIERLDRIKPGNKWQPFFRFLIDKK